MRVITGKYKGRHFDVPRTFKARPTTDFAKENLFNVLQAYIDFAADSPSALDLFAGTGSITLELLSRGCSRVLAIEKEALHCSFIRSFLNTLNDHNGVVVRADVLRFLPRCSERFDLIFADPPYMLPELEQLPDLIFRPTPVMNDASTTVSAASSLLNADGLFILEHGKNHDFSSHPHFVEHRAYGSVNFSFFQ